MTRRGRLEGKVAIVTGGAGGIGAATCTLFCAEGAKVVIADLAGEAAESLASELRRAGGEARAFRLDLDDPQSVQDMVAFAVDQFGALHILDNNAAAAHLAANVDGPLETMDPEVWDETMRVNLRGPMLAMKAAIPHLRAAGGGAIVNILSNSYAGGDMGPTAYAASKGGLAVLTKYVATQHGQEGVRCNAISPGLIPIAAKATPAREAYRQRMRDHELTPRSGLPEDVAHAACFLASDEAGFINGQVLHVDGGVSAHLSPFVDGVRLKRSAQLT
jgi:NAD(P)-dependent dehydrogenase (short-subunit alcohol dehydrogenase family)